MAEHRILNPTPRSPLNPDYGWQKKRPVTHVVAKASGGPAYFREMTDMGHQFLLNWGTTMDCAKMPADIHRLKWFYEQYRDGFFTLIDHEGGGRHYVGRFTTPVEGIPVSHNHWAVQNVLFEEVPGVNMLKYPGNWEADAVWRHPFSDFNELKVAVSGSWSVDTNALSLTGRDLIDNAAIGNTASVAYVGYGFQFWARTGFAQGISNLFLDGVQVATIDEYSATANPASMLHQELNVPLGLHTVQLVSTGTKDSASAWAATIWDSLLVMR